MVKATLTETDEFLSEVDRDREEIHRGIVRVSHLLKPSRESALTAVTVEASYSVDGEIIRLQKFIGYLWGIESQDEPVKTAAKEIIRKVEEEVAGRGLQVRAGALEGGS